MAFDGIMMTMVRREMSDVLISSRVSQIYQPARDELVFAFRTQDGAKKVLTAAALTYVAALATTLMQLLRFLIILNDRRR